MGKKHLIYWIAAVILLVALPFTVTAKDGAPIPQNMQLQTYRGVAMEGQLTATDAEGDAIVSYQLTTPPVKGEVIINTDGTFLYTPKENKRGKDYFGYTATDDKGNISQEATVIITLLKQKTDVSYTDLKNDGIHYDALRLAESGIFTGEQVGGQYVFSPNTMVSRGEFLSMCVALSDTPVLSGVTDTGFSDDSNIPHWQKNYIATALMTGSISEVNETGSTAFDSTSPITCAQAAVMVDRIFSLSKVTAMNLNDSTPSWAAQSVANLIACNVLSENCDTAQYLNRAMVADMLSGVMDILENR